MTIRAVDYPASFRLRNPNWHAHWVLLPRFILLQDDEKIWHVAFHRIARRWSSKQECWIYARIGTVHLGTRAFWRCGERIESGAI